MSRELMPWAIDAAMDFRRQFGHGNCSCHIRPPCPSCTHEGNPLNLEETPEAWGELHVVMALESQEILARFVDQLAAKHLSEMKASWKGGAP
jgi:hypothetical protein